jgi:hypothetical protein
MESYRHSGYPAAGLDLDMKSLFEGNHAELRRYRRLLDASIAKLTVFVLLLVAFAMLSGCRTTPLNKKEAAEWYGTWGSMVRWVGYRGSDVHYHYYIARVMDDWQFLRFDKAELNVDDERPYSSLSSGPFYHYLVDPRHDYAKVEK